MRFLLTAILFMGLSTIARAGGLCHTLEEISRVEDASRNFVSSSTEAGRRAALTQMSRALEKVEGTDFSRPVFEGVGDFLVTFMHSRRHVLRRAENDGIGAALATARAASYAGIARAFDGVYHPMNCARPVEALARSEQSGDLRAGSDAKQMSARQPFDFPASTVALLAFAMAGAGGTGYRYISRQMVVDRRRAKRFGCLIDVTVRTDRSLCDSSMHDVSQLGCKLKQVQRVKVGERVEIGFRDIRREGRIIWSNRHYAGVKFDKRLSSTEMRAAIGVAP